MNIINEIEGVIYVDELPNNSPMGGYLETKQIIVSMAEYHNYTPNERLAMFHHEQAHFINNDNNEMDADLIGFLIYVQAGNTDLDATISWMEKLFSADDATQMERLKKQRERVAAYKLHGNKLVLASGPMEVLIGGAKANKVGVVGFDAISGITNGLSGIIGGIGGIINDRALSGDQVDIADVNAYSNITTAQLAIVQQQLKQKQTQMIVFSIIGVALIFAMVYYLKTPKK